MSAFDVDDPFTSQIHQAQQQQQQQQQKAASAPLKKPPKWLRRPCGATFAVSLNDYTYVYSSWNMCMVKMISAENSSNNGKNKVTKKKRHSMVIF